MVLCLAKIKQKLFLNKGENQVDSHFFGLIGAQLSTKTNTITRLAKPISISLTANN